MKKIIVISVLALLLGFGIAAGGWWLWLRGSGAGRQFHVAGAGVSGFFGRERGCAAPLTLPSPPEEGGEGFGFCGEGRW